MESTYIYIDSAATDIYPNNKPGEFSVKLPKSEIFSSDWDIGLAGVEINAPLPITQSVYIECSIVLHSFVVNTCKRVLRRITLNSGKFNKDFETVHYFPVDNTSAIDTIHIKLLHSQTLSPIDIGAGLVTCLLHFKKV